MKNKIRAFLVIGALLIAQLACNLPGQTGSATSLPAPNQTLTALFAITPANTTAQAGQPTYTAVQPTPASATYTPAQPAPTLTPRPTYTAVKPAPTQAIQPTATIPGTRLRAQIKAPYLRTPPVIDGDWSEWKNNTTEYPANSVVWGGANWTGADDLSSSFHVGWDNNNLYIAVKVRDDKYVQNASGADLYKGDSLELLLDTDLQGDYYYQQLSPDDFQLGISPGRPNPDGTKEAYLWFPSNIAGKRNNIQIGSRLENGVYRVEAAIPWSIFEMTPVSGRHYGFSLSVNDNDDPNNNLQQSMVSNVPGRRLTDPTTWGDLQLVK